MTEMTTDPLFGTAPVEAPHPPLVSVVVATHNRPELLRAALGAVLDQDYAGPIECLLVFDRSEPDLTLTSDDARRRVRVLTNSTRSPGLAGARNTGILEARGEYVAFCDDDDEWRPSKLGAQIDALEASGALTSVTGITIAYADREVDRVPLPEEMDIAHLARRRVMAAHPSSVVVRREALLGPIGLVDEEIPGSHGEDYDWILRASGAGAIAVVPQALVRVRWGQSFFSQKWQTIYDALEYVLRKHPVLQQDRHGLARIRGQQAFALAALGHRRQSLRMAARTARLHLAEPRAYLAVAVALRLTSAPRVMDLLHRRGRGV